MLKTVHTHIPEPPRVGGGVVRDILFCDWGKSVRSATVFNYRHFPIIGFRKRSISYHRICEFTPPPPDPLASTFVKNIEKCLNSFSAKLLEWFGWNFKGCFLGSLGSFSENFSSIGSLWKFLLYGEWRVLSSPYIVKYSVIPSNWNF